MLEYLKSEINRITKNVNKNSWHIHIKKNKELTEQIINETSYLPEYCKFNERIYNILNDITSRVQCLKEECNKNVSFQHFKYGYSKHCSIKCARTNIISIQNTTIKCQFGCDKIAKYFINGAHYCCTTAHQKCSEVRKKNSKNNAGENNAMHGKHSANRYTIEDWYKIYPFFCKIEKPKFNEHGKIIVKCKKCEKWFAPDSESLRSRRDALEHPDGNGGHYLYCSNECKGSCSLFNLRPEYFLNRENDKSLISINERSIWKKEVFLRQKTSVGQNQCELCGNTNLNELECHHEKPIKLFPHLALDPDNGIILCGGNSEKNCHHKIGHQGECSTGSLANKILC